MVAANKQSSVPSAQVFLMPTRVPIPAEPSDDLHHEMIQRLNQQEQPFNEIGVP